MELVNFEKEAPDAGGLRLVSAGREPQKSPVLEKQFVNFMFFRVSPEWRKLGAETKAAFKAEFRDVFDQFGRDFLLYAYSLVGFDSKADLMFWRIGDSLDLIQEMTAKMYRTNLGSYLETADAYLSVTKKMVFISAAEDPGAESRYRVKAGEKKYLFLYPCSKLGEWHAKTGEERDQLIEENFMVGKKFPNIKIHLTHAFGFSDQEYIISFETDEPKDFLALTEELRETATGKFALRGMPVYTCRQRALAECLDALG